VAMEIPLGEAWSTSLATLAEAADTVTLPVTSDEEYALIHAVRRNADGYILTKRTREEMDTLYWHGKVAATASQGRCTDYAILESAAQVVTLRFQAPSDRSEALDVLRSILPTDLTASTDTLPLSRPVRNAVADLAAAEGAAKMPKWERDEKLRLNPEVIGFWTARAMSNIRAEVIRRNRQHSTGRPHRRPRRV